MYFFCTPSTRKLSLSLPPASQDTAHQKLSVPAPPTVVRMYELWLL